MSKPYNPFSVAADMISAAMAIRALFEALTDQGFNETQALAIVRDAVRPVGVQS
ncbi:hypothetical protein [Streptomyces sp. NPDC092370]|uniref:hypothetical protein n=1 Tax=Streptomyces sp. NPDC092370 TaxID=3366016 RepID=UPI0038105827